MSKEESAAPETGGQGGPGNDSAKKDPNSELYEGGATKKLIRLATVMAYMFSVSFMGLSLSAYYLFLWEPPNPRLIQRTHHLSSEPQAEFFISDPLSALNFSLEELDSRDSRTKNFTANGRAWSTSEIMSKPQGGNQFVGESGTKNKFNESVFLLRISMIDSIRHNRSEDQKIGLDAVETIESTANSTEFGLNEGKKKFRREKLLADGDVIPSKVLAINGIASESGGSNDGFPAKSSIIDDRGTSSRSVSDFTDSPVPAAGADDTHEIAKPNFEPRNPRRIRTYRHTFTSKKTHPSYELARKSESFINSSYMKRKAAFPKLRKVATNSDETQTQATPQYPGLSPALKPELNSTTQDNEDVSVLTGWGSPSSTSVPSTSDIPSLPDTKSTTTDALLTANPAEWQENNATNAN